MTKTNGSLLTIVILSLAVSFTATAAEPVTPKLTDKLDKEFHQLAASLAEAGRNDDTEKQHQLFGNMTGNCIQCHSTYVSDRFPDVKSVRD